MIKCYKDIEQFKQTCETSSVMVARAAMWNCSVFRKEGLLSIEEVLRRYLKIVI